MLIGRSMILATLVAASASCLAGAKSAEFTLRDYRGKEFALNGIAEGKKATVIAFLGVECPLAKSYALRLNNLAKDYGAKGVAFVAVDSNVQDSLAEMSQFAKEHSLAFPFLKDPGNKIADALGVTRTPEVVLLDADRLVKYQGRIDDQYGFGLTAGYAKTVAKELYLTAAIDDLLAGRAVKLAKTEPVGCLIGRERTPKSGGNVTYSNQIARIFQSKCVECHRTGEVAPFPMTSYDEVVGWAGMILEVTDQRRMPPWYADPQHGKFSNDVRLSDDELAQIRAWVDAGCPEGDKSQLPTPVTYPDGWRIDKPDQVVYIDDHGFDVPADGVVPYKYFTVDPGWKEEKWIQATEARPGNRAVVHHIIVFAIPPGAEGRGGGIDGGRVGISGYAPGEQPRIYPPGVALRVPPGVKLSFQMHYTPNGTATTDRSAVAFRFADPKEVKKKAFQGAAINASFLIPPGADNHPVVSRYTFRKDMMLTSLFPHMHLRGKSFSFTAVYPDGKKEVLLDVPHYDFNWQLRYDLAQFKLMPKGTELVCQAHFDNSAENPANPDPKKSVHFGPQTWDEMMIGFFTTIPTDSDPNPLGEPKKKKPAAAEQGGE